MGNELVVQENRPLTKVEVVAQKRLIQEVMEAVMKEGTHYGTIPGCKQPSLYKPGSECILSTFRIAVEVDVEDLSGMDFFRYRTKVRGVLPDGTVIGCGIGECSTEEEKYKWRGAVCPEEFDAAPEDRRRTIWKKADKWHKDNYQVKQVRTNPADLANTALKMSKKRGQIDMTLTATSASDVFAQDLEDLPEEVRDEMIKEEGQSRAQGKPAVQQPQTKAPTTTDNGDKATEGQVKMLHVKIKQSGVTEASFKAHYKIESVSDLPKSLVNEAIRALGAGEVKGLDKEAAPTEQVETIPCKNCGEQIDPIKNTGHLIDCPYAGN